MYKWLNIDEWIKINKQKSRAIKDHLPIKQNRDSNTIKLTLIQTHQLFGVTVDRMMDFAYASNRISLGDKLTHA